MSALLARRERDGLSLRALSEESGIPFGTLSWWSWRLRQDPARAKPTETPFVELTATDRQPDREIVVRLGNDIEVAIVPGTDVAWVRELITALRPC